MLWIVLIIFIMILVITKKYDRKFSFDTDALIGLMQVGIMATSIALLVCILGYMTDYYNVDKKIELYESQNQKIETEVKEVAESYKNYEKEIIEKITPENALVFIPELKSSEIVLLEIETYKENTIKIVELKERRIDKKILERLITFNWKEEE